MTASGQKPEVASLKCEVSSTLRSGHRQAVAACLVRAKLRHCDASCDYRVGGRDLAAGDQPVCPTAADQTFAEDDGDCGEFNGYCSGVTRRAYA